jgi:hypothetical protein
VTTEPISDERLAEIRADALLLLSAPFEVYPRISTRTILALLSRLDKAEAGWQDISTAPKQQDVLLRRYGMPPIVAGWFEHEDAGGDWFTFENPNTPVRGEITHWAAIDENCDRPLPPPPSES